MILVFLFGCCAGVYLALHWVSPLLGSLAQDWSSGPRDWSLDTVQQVWGLSIPASAEGIQFNAASYGSFVRMAFFAPPEDAEVFARSVCDRALRPGYNPFAAIDSYQHAFGAIYVSGGGYFSSSAGMPEVYEGMRCSPNAGERWLLVDRTQNERWHVLFESHSCMTDSEMLSCRAYRFIPYRFVLEQEAMRLRRSHPPVMMMD